MRLAATCVEWPRHRLDDLRAMIDSAINITARTFRERIGIEHVFTTTGRLPNG